MAIEPTIGERLLALKEHSGLSLAQIAKRGGYQGASSIQKLFKREYGPAALPEPTANRLAMAFEGAGDPGIDPLEVLALTKDAESFEKAYADISHNMKLASKTVAFFKTKRIASTVETENGYQVPLFITDPSNQGLEYTECPEHLRPRRLSGLYITIGNMWPRFEEGEPIVYEYGKPPSIGDDVIIKLIDDDNLDGAMVIGRLRLLHEEEIQIDQLSPAGRIVLPRNAVIAVYRILSATNMLPPLRYAQFD